METIPLGGIIAIAIILPNLLVVFYPPNLKQANVSVRVDRLSQAMNIFERVGQIGSFTIPFFYQLKCSTILDITILIIMSGALVIYFTGWTRYIVKGRNEGLFYKSMFGLPLPMAIMPVVYFISASVLLSSGWLLTSAILIGAGHITVSWQHSRCIDHQTVMK